MSSPPKTALITGASSGLGEALAKDLGRRGTKLVLVARRKDLLDALAKELGDGHVTIEADLRDPERAARVVSEGAEKLGAPLDLVIANAGGNTMGAVQRIGVPAAIDVLRLNTLGAVATLMAALPSMLERKQGQLVGISSLAGLRGFPKSAAYSASKAALSAFIEGMRLDLSGTGIGVTDVQMGFVDTPLLRRGKPPAAFVLTAERAAAKILRAVERRRPVYAFPWPTAFAARFGRLLPPFLWDFVMTRVRL
jgi:short-subunit dehydrogenase